ncbi:hypothetical protein S40288_09293 [Stachybotrys chartarum IBT 40288]|nr:hypothetical protein S40288_09293 [Stachybotrys chartarum IBT 40288]
MIPDSFLYYVFIRLSIWALRAITPLSGVYCFVKVLGCSPFLPRPVELLAYAEALFYLLVSLPGQWLLDKSQPRPVHRSRQERQELFERCWASIPDLEAFLSTWFKCVPLSSIRREDLEDFLAWGFFYRSKPSASDREEIEEYIRRTEKMLGRTIPPGSGSCRPSQVSIDGLRLQHKPLIFYVFAVGVDDFITYLTAWFIGLQHYRLPLAGFFTVFPFRPHTLLSKSKSPSENLSYWYRPHTSTKTLPVLFIHGIGAGMRTYTGFFRDFIEIDGANDGQTGIIAIELMPINHHGWDKFSLMGHSYGTIIATHILQHLGDTGRLGPMLLVDPVTISIHWGGVPYNFLYRKPRKASEWQLHYFASTDMCVAHSITRRFDWSENVLWKSQMKGRTMTVALASRDIILDTNALQEYLVGDAKLKSQLVNSRDVLDKQWKPTQEGLDVIWYDELNHAEMFDSAEAWRPLVKILHAYCSILE